MANENENENENEKRIPRRVDPLGSVARYSGDDRINILDEANADIERLSRSTKENIRHCIHRVVLSIKDCSILQSENFINEDDMFFSIGIGCDIVSFGWQYVEPKPRLFVIAHICNLGTLKSFLRKILGNLCFCYTKCIYKTKRHYAFYKSKL